MAIGRVPDAAEETGDGVFAEINITPLTDIFLVLLIIFMVTSSALVDAGGQAGVKVNLPKGGARELTPAESDIAVAVLQDGRRVVGGKVLDDQEIGELFKQAAQRAPETIVIIQADEGVAHGKVVEVMELAKTAGLGHLAIATQAP